MEIEIRPYQTSDAPGLTGIFYRAVEALAGTCYSRQEVRAWAPLPIAYVEWQSRLEHEQPWVVVLSHRPVGFISLHPDGLIGLAYVDPAFQRRGVGRSLYVHLEREDRARGMKRLHVEASHAAKPLFERMDYAVVERNKKRIGHTVLVNWRMQKPILPA